MREEPIRQESYGLVDRLAAAFMRGDIECARDIADDFLRRCEARGYRKKEEDLAGQSRDEMRFSREANAWFETKDGLMCVKMIESSQGVFPQIWKLACHTQESIKDFEAPPAYKPIEVRTYEFKRRHKDGRPIYTEI